MISYILTSVFFVVVFISLAVHFGISGFMDFITSLILAVCYTAIFFGVLLIINCIILGETVKAPKQETQITETADTTKASLCSLASNGDPFTIGIGANEDGLYYICFVQTDRGLELKKYEATSTFIQKTNEVDPCVMSQEVTPESDLSRGAELFCMEWMKRVLIKPVTQSILYVPEDVITQPYEPTHSE